MPYQRGDVVEIHFLLPHNNRHAEHPAIIISNDAVYDADEIYICVMVTHSSANDELSFELNDSMFENSRQAIQGYAKAHLIAYALDKHIVRNSSVKRSRMKAAYVNKLVDFISDTALSDN